MMRFAIVRSDGEIVSILTVGTIEDLAANIPDDCEAYACPDPQVVAGSWKWAAEEGFVQKPLELPAPAPRRFTFNEWVDLFPTGEQVAIVTATMTDPLAKLIYDRAQSASGSIDPQDPRTLEGLSYLVSKGWVSAETYARIAGDAA